MQTATEPKPDAKAKAKRAPKPLTPREKRLLVALPEAKDLKAALLSAGYSESTASKAQTRITENMLGKVRQSGMPEALEKVGIDMDFLAGKHKEGLEAYKVISAKVVEKGAGAADNDFIEVPDFPARHKHLDTIHKLRSDFPNEKIDLNAAVAHTIEVVNYGDDKGDK